MINSIFPVSLKILKNLKEPMARKTILLPLLSKSHEMIKKGLNSIVVRVRPLSRDAGG